MWKKWLEVYYFFVRHIYMWIGIFNNNKLGKIEDLSNVKNRKTIVIRNLDDPFTSPSIKDILKDKSVEYLEMPGIHDDYTVHPKPYIDLLLKEI